MTDPAPAQGWPRAALLRFVAGCAVLVAGVAWQYLRDAPGRGGTAFQHLASVRELARGEFPPRHNLIAGRAPQGHYGPYFVALGWTARSTGAAPRTVLYTAGVLLALAFALALGWATDRLIGPEAASWSPWCAALLWGPWPGRTIEWTAWGWPGTTSLADAQNFFYPQHAAVVLLLVVVALLARPSTSDPLTAKAWGGALAASAVLVATHPLTGIALGVVAASHAAVDLYPRPRRRAFAVLAIPPLALALASVWPYYPVLGLLEAFVHPGIRQSTAALGPATPPSAPTAPVASAPVPSPPPSPPPPGPTPVVSVLGPALFGVAGALAGRHRHRAFLLVWTAASVGAVFCPLLPLRQRLVMFAALPLQIGAAALCADRRRLVRGIAIALLAAGALSAGLRVRWLLRQEPIDLSFVAELVPEEAIVLADPRTSNAVAGLTGRKIVAPEGPDIFLVLAGGWQRNADVERFLHGAPDEERRAILERWQVTHVLVDRLGDGGPELPYPVLHEGGGYVLYDVRGRDAISR